MTNYATGTTGDPSQIPRVIMGYGLGALEGAYKSLTPRIWHEQDYAPEQWEDWYSSIKDGGAYQKTHQDFLARATPAMNALFREFLNTAVADVTRDELTPSRTRNQTVLGDIIEGPDPVAIENAKKRKLLVDITNGILGQPYDRENQRANALRTAFLDWVQGTALGGEERSDNSVTPEQYAAWTTPAGKANTMGGLAQEALDTFDADYRLTPEGQKQMQRLADYNLLTTFQTDNRHRPEHLKSPAMSAVQSLVGLPLAGLFGDDKGMAHKQFANTMGGTPRDAMLNAIARDDLTRQQMQADPEFFNRGFTGSALPQYSALTPAGLNYKTGSGGTRFGRSQRWLSGPFILPNAVEQERQDLYDYQRLNDRVTPIRSPETGNPLDGELAKDDVRLSKDIGELEAQGWKVVSDNLPDQIYKFNDATGANITPFYPPAAVNDAAMVIPGMIADPGNLGLSLGMALLGAGPAALLAANVQDAPSEMAYNAAIQLGASPQPWGEYLTKPDPGVSLRTPDGRIPDPANRQEYYAAKRAKDETVQNVLRSAGDWLNTQRSRQSKPKPLTSQPFSSENSFLPP